TRQLPQAPQWRRTVSRQRPSQAWSLLSQISWRIAFMGDPAALEYFADRLLHVGQKRTRVWDSDMHQDKRLKARCMDPFKRDA
ncbi:hypothetical protein, partial [Mesorhizobium sp. M7A.F.Ca.US.007.01.2.1]|uniref:hypothetical protein n=1 Tax=Mesorhizobium sp. M7A.F.Ca.US.007.01.2.1 TaxID=2496711 RepID=UPI0019CFAF4F